MIDFQIILHDILISIDPLQTILLLLFSTINLALFWIIIHATVFIFFLESADVGCIVIFDICLMVVLLLFRDVFEIDDSINTIWRASITIILSEPLCLYLLDYLGPRVLLLAHIDAFWKTVAIVIIEFILVFLMQLRQFIIFLASKVLYLWLHWVHFNIYIQSITMIYRII